MSSPPSFFDCDYNYIIIIKIDRNLHTYNIHQLNVYLENKLFWNGTLENFDFYPLKGALDFCEAQAKTSHLRV